jgi:imidazolonepropionase-like amidohydrolase
VSEPTAPLTVRGVLLPDDELTTLTLAAGCVVAAAVGATPAAADLTGWIVPGLVDAHCHIGLGTAGAVDRATARGHARADRDAGALLLRDAGSPADTRWVDDEPELPRLIRAGRHIARTRRYQRGFAVEVEPPDLVAAVHAQAAVGDGWVKIVGDWIDRDAGDLGPCWADGELAAAVAAAHALGVRVAVHVFGEDALPGVLAARPDSVEHGIGLSDRQLAFMADAGIALVPTRVQIANFEGFAAAGEAKFPRYAARMRALHARADHLLLSAHEAGVALYAGTDAGGVNGHGLLPTEIAMLASAGIPAVDALAAGSWAAREWLGADSGVAVGESADLVVYPADPRLEPAVLHHPTAVVLRGRVFRPAP